MGMKVLIKKDNVKDRGREYLIRDANKDFHCKEGMVSSKELKQKTAKTNTGKEFYCIDAGFIDKFKRIKRGAQIPMPKDFGIIAAETGINKKSIVADAGSGSGALTCFLANICKKVYSYEIRKDFFDLVKKNIEFLQLKNIKLINDDINNIKEKNLDLITLDMPEPWTVLDNTTKALKQGGFLIAYLPTITQVMNLVKAFEKNKEIIFLKSVELIEREWHVDGKKIRPVSQITAHTGFIVFARKV